MLVGAEVGQPLEGAVVVGTGRAVVRRGVLDLEASCIRLTSVLHPSYMRLTCVLHPSYIRLRLRKTGCLRKSKTGRLRKSKTGRLRPSKTGRLR